MCSRLLAFMNIDFKPKENASCANKWAPPIVGRDVLYYWIYTLGHMYHRCAATAALIQSGEDHELRAEFNIYPGCKMAEAQTVLTLAYADRVSFYCPVSRGNRSLDYNRSVVFGLIHCCCPALPLNTFVEYNCSVLGCLRLAGAFLLTHC